METEIQNDQGQFKSGGHRGLARSLTLVVVIALAGMASSLPALLKMRGYPPSWNNGEIDTALIHGGLVKAPHFLDTLHWWSGTWAGQVPFYRPLTSYVFWIEWKLFGDAEWLYVLPTMAAHLAGVLIFTWLAFRLAERYEVPRPHLAAVIAGWGFSGFLISYRGIVAETVFFRWKNQPDSFAAICACASLLCYLRAQSGHPRFLYAAVGWYLASCGFKESAVTLPIVCAALEFQMLRGEGRLGAIRRLAVMLAVAAAFVVYRSIVLHGIGYSYGTNTQWFGRVVSELVGPFRSTLISHVWLGNAMGVVVILAGWRFFNVWNRGDAASDPKRWALVPRYVLAILVGWTILGAADTVALGGMDPLTSIQPFGWIVGLNRASDPNSLAEAAATCAVILSIAVVWRLRRDAAWLCLAWTAGLLIMIAFSPGAIHRSYLPQGGYYLLYGFAGAIACVQLAARIKRPIVPESR